MLTLAKDLAPAYLDYAATTPLDPRVRAFMVESLSDPELDANPSSSHAAGRACAARIAIARQHIGALLNADPERLWFTSGATESDNLAILGTARFWSDQGRHLISMRTEHKAVTDPLQQLERQGYEVTWLTPQANGQVDLDDLKSALRSDTQLVSLMHVNNETGVVQDIAAIADVCAKHHVRLHVDAAQSFGKLDIDVGAWPVDFVSITAHKCYGPAGIGALYIADRPGLQLEPLLYGGGQQQRLRPGSLPARAIVAFGEAARLAALDRDQDLKRLQQLRDRLWSGIRDLGGLTVNGDLDSGYPGILNFSAEGIEGESLLLALEPLCVATGSACNSQNTEPSSVLRALGRSDAQAQSAIRFSFGRGTRDADIDLAIERYRAAVAHLRALAPAA